MENPIVKVNIKHQSPVKLRQTQEELKKISNIDQAIVKYYNMFNPGDTTDFNFKRFVFLNTYARICSLVVYDTADELVKMTKDFNLKNRTNLTVSSKMLRAAKKLRDSIEEQRHWSQALADDFANYLSDLDDANISKEYDEFIEISEIHEAFYKLLSNILMYANGNIEFLKNLWKFLSQRKKEDLLDAEEPNWNFIRELVKSNDSKVEQF